MLSLSSRSVGRVARPARLGARNRRARIGASVPQRGFRRGIVRAAAADDDDADDADETHREYDETYDETHLEDASTHTEDDDADVAAFKAFSADLDARYGLRSQPPPRAAYVSAPAGPSSSLNPQGAPVTPMSGVQNNIFNVGLLSTAVLGIWAVKKATDAFNSIPNLAAEDRLLRMADFADAAMERAKEMPDGKAKDKELARVTKLKASIDGKKAKLLEAERRRDEWERRIKRVDSDGVPVVKSAAARERKRREARAPASARRGTDTGGDDDMKEERDGSTSSSSSEEFIDGEEDSRDDSIDDSTTERSPSPSIARERDARYEAAMARAQARERAPPGAGARWMKASDYLQRQMDKTAVGYSPEEAVDDQNRQSDSEIKITEEDAAKEAKAKAAKEAEEYRAKAAKEADAKAAREEAEAARAKAMAEAEAEAKAEVKTVPPTPAFDSARGKGPVFDPEIVDNMDDLKGGNLSPQDELELEREIKRLEERYGDDRNVSAEELDAKCQEIIDKYGLGSRRFTENEKYDPRDDPKMEVKHPSETNPFYWRKLRAVHPILEADPASKSMGIMTMMMTHPGLPAYLPVRVYFYFLFLFTYRMGNKHDDIVFCFVNRGTKNRAISCTPSLSRARRTRNASAGSCEPRRRKAARRACVPRVRCRPRRWRPWRMSARTE